MWNWGEERSVGFYEEAVRWSELGRLTYPCRSRVRQVPGQRDIETKLE